MSDSIGEVSYKPMSLQPGFTVYDKVPDQPQN
jgi:hypothetical protein